MNVWRRRPYIMYVYYPIFAKGTDEGDALLPMTLEDLDILRIPSFNESDELLSSSFFFAE